MASRPFTQGYRKVGIDCSTSWQTQSLHPEALSDTPMDAIDLPLVLVNDCSNARYFWTLRWPCHSPTIGEGAIATSLGSGSR